jgi:hypothetical protein
MGQNGARGANGQRTKNRKSEKKIWEIETTNGQMGRWADGQRINQGVWGELKKLRQICFPHLSERQGKSIADTRPCKIFLEYDFYSES